MKGSKLYIVSEGQLKGYVYSEYASCHDNLNNVLSDTVFVNINTQAAVITIPTCEPKSNWLQVDDTWTLGMKATKDGWVFDNVKGDLG